MPINRIRKALRSQLTGAKPEDGFAATVVQPADGKVEDWQRRIAIVTDAMANEISLYRTQPNDVAKQMRHRIEMRLAEIFAPELWECCQAVDRGVLGDGMDEFKKQAPPEERTPAGQINYLLSLLDNTSTEKSPVNKAQKAMSQSTRDLAELVNGIWADTIHERTEPLATKIDRMQQQAAILYNKKDEANRAKYEILKAQIDLAIAKQIFPHICSIVDEMLERRKSAQKIGTAQETAFVDRRTTPARDVVDAVPSAFAPPTISRLSDSQSAGKLAPTPSRDPDEPEPSRL